LAQLIFLFTPLYRLNHCTSTVYSIIFWDRSVYLCYIFNDKT